MYLHRIFEKYLASIGKESDWPIEWTKQIGWEDSIQHFSMDFLTNARQLFNVNVHKYAKVIQLKINSNIRYSISIVLVLLWIFATFKYTLFLRKVRSHMLKLSLLIFFLSNEKIWWFSMGIHIVNSSHYFDLSELRFCGLYSQSLSSLLKQIMN